MTLTVSNTLSGESEVFEPGEPGRVSLYFCGLTVSDDAHLGHARSWVHVDVIRRWFEHLGYDVTHVENFTDVNEKIVARVGADGDTEAEVADHYIERVIADMRSLNLRRADVYPRVSEHVPEIIDLIETLIEGGYAYESNGSVYFDVTTFPNYGCLSNQNVEEMEVQEEEGPPTEKRHPQDFALWKAGRPSPGEVGPHQHDEAALAPDAAVEGAMTFESPWDEGRPGWHIECSAMSTAHLGDSFDVHLAGTDIVFPHNENEIAQSEAATGERFAAYWLHVGLLRTKGEKMSSSLQNYFLVRDAVERYGPNVLRTFFLSSVYRAEQQFGEETIDEAAERWDRIERAHDRAVSALDGVDARTKPVDEALRAATADATAGFEDAMNDDFNTREAMAALLDLAGAIHRHVDGTDEFDYRGLLAAVDAFERFGTDVFGLQFGDGRADDLGDELIELVLEIREHARTTGDFERADELRAALADRGVEVQDTDEGPRYRIDR